jgi:hypothetical protein
MYYAAAQNTFPVGMQIANLLIRLKANYSMVHCIGHSLGAHVCGHCGKIVKLGRISGKINEMFKKWV